MDRRLSRWASRLTAWAGAFRSPQARDDEPALTLYDRERDPGCRRVRQALSELDLPCLIVPCKRGDAFDAPLLVDATAEDEVQGADEIVSALYDRYADRDAPDTVGLLAIAALNHVVDALRPPRRRQAATVRPMQPLELWGFEACPGTRRVRESLHDLGLAFVSLPVPYGSPRRAELHRMMGSTSTPVLCDPGGACYQQDADEIIAYVRDRYGPPARVDLASRHSFPASDPPSYMPR